MNRGLCNKCGYLSEELSFIDEQWQCPKCVSKTSEEIERRERFALEILKSLVIGIGFNVESQEKEAAAFAVRQADELIAALGEHDDREEDM